MAGPAAWPASVRFGVGVMPPRLPCCGGPDRGCIAGAGTAFTFAPSCTTSLGVVATSAPCDGLEVIARDAVALSRNGFENRDLRALGAGNQAFVGNEDGGGDG